MSLDAILSKQDSLMASVVRDNIYLLNVKMIQIERNIGDNIYTMDKLCFIINYSTESSTYYEKMLLSLLDSLCENVITLEKILQNMLDRDVAKIDDTLIRVFDLDDVNQYDRRKSLVDDIEELIKKTKEKRLGCEAMMTNIAERLDNRGDDNERIHRDTIR